MEQMTARTPIPVYFLLRERTLALDLIGPAEVFRYANRIAEQRGLPALFALRYISAAPRVDTSIGLDLAGVTGLPDELPANAMLILIGCEGDDTDFSSTAAKNAIAWLRRHVTPQHRLLCICTGALFAGYAGLLDGRQCTTHHSHYDDLRRLAPRAHVLENRIFVEDGFACTSAGVTTGIDLALHVVTQIAGYQFSSVIARTMVIYLRRTGNDPQASPWLAFRNHVHPAVHRVQDAIIGNPTQDWNIAQLAQIACTSERHLTRLFREQAGTGIVDYLQRIRIALARELLTQSELDIERVAEKAGFNSSRQLRRIWKKFEDVSPSRFRTVDSVIQ
jgi:transcriptional regulator GlxA family with amidase domain